MTINTTKDRVEAGATTVIEPPPDLEARIKQRREELIDKLGGLRGDVRREAVESRDRLKAKLSELAHILKWGVVDGWTSLGTPLTTKLELWLAESARQLVAKGEQA